VGRLTYAAMLFFVLLATLPLEVLLRTRVYARLRRLALVLACVGVPFVLWDLAAVHAGHWSFDGSLTLGVDLAGLPLEEVLFFVVVPVASVMTLEAVRSVRGWPAGDEPLDESLDEPTDERDAS
jgi:lycopene cyclase domain-containing protein